MAKFVINNTTYRFNAAIAALIKVGSTKDLGSSELVTPTLPDGVSLKGRSQVSRSELFHIGKKDANFNEDDVERLHRIRNDFDSHEDFLNSPVKPFDGSGGKRHIIYHSPNMEMSRKVHGGLLSGAKNNPNPKVTDDEITFVVGGSMNRDESNSKKHIKEMGNLTKVFQHFVDHPSGKRFYSVFPVGKTQEEQYSKARFYQKSGGFNFLNSDPSSDAKEVVYMFANHISPDHLKEKHNLEYKKRIGQRIAGVSNEPPEYRPTKIGKQVIKRGIDYFVNAGFSDKDANRAMKILNGDSFDHQSSHDRKVISALHKRGFLEKDE